MPPPTTSGTCPACGAPVTADVGFVSWCPACDWNVDPSPPAAPTGTRERRAAERFTRDAARATDGASRLASYAIAVTVHAVTVLLLLVGVAIVARTWPHPLGVLPGALLVGAAVGLRPRLGRLSKRALTLDRTDAPALFALLDRIAHAADARPVDLVVVTGDYNAGSTTIGIRRRRVVAIGLPLWLALDAQGRVAVLAHEIAHQVNGDVRRAIIVGSSIDALADWYGTFRWPSGHTGSVEPLELAARAVLWPVSLIVGLVLRLQLRLTLRSHRAGEYRADGLAARVASTEAAARGLEATLLAPAHLRALQHESRFGSGSLWDRLRTSVETIPDGERERLRRVSRLRLVRVDATHPPTAHRLDALTAEPSVPALVELKVDEAAVIDREVFAGAGSIEVELREALRAWDLAG